MAYYWTAEINSGHFHLWQVENEKSLLKQAKELYEEKPFAYGETIEATYQREKKYSTSCPTSDGCRY